MKEKEGRVKVITTSNVIKYIYLKSRVFLAGRTFFVSIKPVEFSIIEENFGL